MLISFSKVTNYKIKPKLGSNKYKPLGLFFLHKNTNIRFQQEEDAKRFTNLAMMPFFMLKELEAHEWHPVHLATIFDVSYEYACDRLNYIQNRIQANYLEELNKIKFFTVKKEQTFLHS